MGRCRDARTKIELGDFQTPPGLARTVCQVLVARGLAPRTIVEPTCGTGSLLQAALEAFPGADRVLGADINPEHVAAARTRLGSHAGNTCVTLEQLNFFTRSELVTHGGLPIHNTGAESAAIRDSQSAVGRQAAHHRGAAAAA